MKFRKNWPLIMGSVMLLALCFVLIFPDWLTSKNPYSLSFIKFWISGDGSLKMATAPYPPGPANLLGSDQIGRDLFSFLLYGCRLTLILAIGITSFRFLLALPLGIAAGMSSPTAHRIIDRFNLVFTTIPPLLVAIIVLRIDLFSSLYKSQSIAIFIVTLALVGWSKIASVVEHSTAAIMSETYILAERAIGKSDTRIAREHVLPHLRSEAIILFFMEIASALTLLMQLGLFSIFVGNLKIIRDSSSGGYSYFNVTFEPEWSSLLGSARDYIRVAPWIALSAGAVFFLTVLAFNLFGEGLRLYFQKTQQSKPVPLFHFFNRKWKIGTALILIAVILLKWPASYGFDAIYNAEALLNQGNQGALTVEGTPRWISAQLSQLNLEAVSEAGYAQTFDKKTSFELDNCQLNFGNTLLTYGQDYVLIGGITGKNTGEVKDFTQDFYQLGEWVGQSQSTHESLNNKLLYIDTRLIPLKNILSQVDQLKATGAAGLLVPEGVEGIVSLALPLPVFSLSEDQALQIETHLTEKIIANYQLTGQPVDGQGINFFAQISGSEPTMAHNTLIIGMDYQAATKALRAEKLAFYFNLISNLNAQKNQINRTVVFALFDSSEGLEYYSEHALVQNKNVNLYLDLTDLENKNFEKISFSDALSPISRYYGFVFANQFKSNAKAWLDQKPAPLTYWDQLLYKEEGLTTLNIKTLGEGDKSLSDLGELLIKTLLENTY